MPMVNLKINNIDITADSEKTILRVVREHALDDIPTLCYEERLGHITSCFLCVVEVEGARGLVPACSTKITEGMVITTDSQKVQESRKSCLELLFSDHYADCISPCARACPAGIDIQGYLSLAGKGLFKEAVQLIKDRNPLPIVCGRVCVRNCEVACRRNLLDEPVAIDFVKRYAAETLEGLTWMPQVKPPRNFRVVIVGGGPAGLSAAYYLAIEGYRVTIEEAMPEAGGMLRYGIPAYRLPKDLLDREIDSIRQLGVEIRCNRKLGRDFQLEDLTSRYDAVLLSPGAWGASAMRVENENSPGVIPGLEILRRTIKGELRELPGRVLVIGGGNTAIDVSRTALRLKASESVIVYRRTEDQMPAHHEEIEAAKREGVSFKFLVAPLKVVTEPSGRAVGLECQKMELGAPDRSGRPRPIPVEGSNYIEKCDYIVAAIGQYPELACLEGDNCRVELDKWKNIAVNPETLETNIPRVFSAGDAVTGPATVIEGIAAGRKAALSIHARLSGEKVSADVHGFGVRKDDFDTVTREELSCFECSKRHPMPEREPGERVDDFEAVELGYSEKETRDESNRCLQCSCLEVEDCLLRKYGDELGVNPVRYRGETNRYKADTSHPFVRIDPAKCIKCGRCIRTCSFILDNSALGFVDRGFVTTIAPAMRKKLTETNCISCGNCIDSCPTGALTENRQLFPRLTSEIVSHPVVCTFCGTGCRMELRTFGREMRIRSLRDKFAGNGDYLCIKGRFGSSYITAEERILKPYINLEGKIHEYTWEQALRHTSEKLREIREKHGPDSIGVFLSPKLTNEEIFTAVHFAEHVIGTGIVGSFREILTGRSPRELDPVTGYTGSTIPQDDVLEADVILLVNANPMETHPSFSWKIREARRRGAKIIVINSSFIDPVRHAELWMQPRRGTCTYLLNAVMHEIVEKNSINEEFITNRTENFGEFRDFLKSFDPGSTRETTGVLSEKIRIASDILTRGNPKIAAVYNFDESADRAAGDLQALTSLLLLTGNLGEQGRGLIILRRHANSRGLHDMGAEPKYTRENHSPNKDTSPEFLLPGKIRGALILGEDPLESSEALRYFKSMEFIAAVDLFPTETTRCADIVLPGSLSIETGGTFTGMDRMVRSFPAASPPRTGMTTLGILNNLAERMGTPMNLTDPAIIFTEIQKANPIYAGIDLSDGKDGDYTGEPGKGEPAPVLFRETFPTPGNRARFVIYPMDTTPYRGDDTPCSSIETFYREKIRKLLMKGRIIPLPG